MTAGDLRTGREKADLTQSKAAAKLGVSQPYLSLLENGERKMPSRLARRVASLYRLSPSTLPLPENWQPRSADPQELAQELAALGYPGFSYLRSRKRRNPAELMLTALSQGDLESRLTEALPWVVLNYPNLDWNWLVSHVKQNALQNRLGFVTNVARRVAVARDDAAATVLSQHEYELDAVRLVGEGTLCRDSLTNAEREWLRESRPEEAKHWNLLTDLEPEHLRYAA
jgi:transcriptional regulator with XRE-family HTH domain